MPPRRKMRAKKSTPKSKLQQAVLESSPVEENTTVSPDLHEVRDQQQLPPSEATVPPQQEDDGESAAKVQEIEEAAQEIEQTGTNKDNGVSVECNAVSSTVMEVRVKKETVQEKNTHIFMEDGVDVNAEDVVEGRGDEEDKVDVAEKGEDASQEKIGVDAKRNEDGGVVGNDSCCQLGIVPEMNSFEGETAATQTSDAGALGHNNNDLAVYEDGNLKGEAEEGGDDEDSEDNEDDEDHALFIQDSLTDRKKQKDLEIFVGGLNKGATEDDLLVAFGKFGEIKTARIIRNSTTKKSKGFAFIRYATIEQAKNALSELEDGIKVRGKRVKISASQGNDTLYMGNICKTWSKERVLEMLKNYGIEHMEEMHLPDDSKKEQKIKGFALLEFRTHSDAMAAFQRLRKPDAVFGRDRSAKVAFTQTSMHPREEVMSQVKKVYLKGLTDVWDEEKVKDTCKQYGEIDKVTLSRNEGTKRKDFGFITFTSRENALACVERINNAQIGEVKVKASMAKPQSKGRLQKQGFRGGFKVEKTNNAFPSKKESEKDKEAGPSKVEGLAKSKQAKRKGKAVAKQQRGPPYELKIIGKPITSQSGNAVSSSGVTFETERTNRKRKNLPPKAEGRGKGGIEHEYGKRPSKKPRGNIRERRSTNKSKNPKKDSHVRKGPGYGVDSATYKNPYAPGYPASTAYYQGPSISATSAYKRHHSDMEPHAGFVKPVAGKQARSYSEYLDPAITLPVESRARYIGPASVPQGQPYAHYLEPAARTLGRPDQRYIEPIYHTQGQSHGGYLQPGVGRYDHGPEDPQLRRAGWHDGQSSIRSDYGGGSALPPYVPGYRNYAIYEGGASVDTHYQRGGTYPPRRSYN